VAKPEWGTKRSCPKCGTRFYDLGKNDPVVCIDCAHEWKPEPILKSKQPVPEEPEKPAAAAEKSSEESEEETAEEAEDLPLEAAEEEVAVEDNSEVEEVVNPPTDEDEQS